MANGMIMADCYKVTMFLAHVKNNLLSCGNVKPVPSTIVCEPTKGLTFNWKLSKVQRT